jgi:hypothetical protein
MQQNRLYLSYYDLERYLLEEVNPRFHAEGSIGAFDLFSIIIWKANRAKSKIAKRLLTRFLDLETAARTLTAAAYKAPIAEQRLLILLGGFGFGLPMATAILSMLYPDEFTVYDVRVCEQLNRFQNLGNRTPARVWPEYQQYRQAVLDTAPTGLSLRDADRYLWARSTADQLRGQIATGFAKVANERVRGTAVTLDKLSPA